MKASTLQFLAKLKKNNNKPWFDKNRNQYEEAREDFIEFAGEVLRLQSKNDQDLKDLEARKCVFRINRDIRFSKDKTPYKLNFAASFDKGGKKSGFAGYYFHLEPGKSFLGGGIWMPEPAITKKLRQEVDYCIDELNKIVTTKKFKSHYPEIFRGEGVELKRVPAGWDSASPAAPFLKLKSWIFLKDLQNEEITSASLVKKTVESFAVLQPFIKFLNRAIE
jgi:uncharacterized protein (TIGR02453 family)